MSKRPFFQRYSLTPVGPGGVRIALSLVALSVAALSVAVLALTVGGALKPPAGDVSAMGPVVDAAPLSDPARPQGREDGLSVPFDIGAIIRQVHFAYAPEGHDFVAGHTTYGVRVSDGTSVAIRPYHSPAGQEERLEPARGSRHKDGRRNHRRAPRVPAIEGEPLELETVALERGGIPIEADDAEASPRVAQDGSLEIPRSGALERLRNHDEGVEQSWSFSERPEGDGDLVVSVAVSGQEPVGETEEGLHFEDPDTGLGSRYGLVTWIDANGDQTDVPVRYHDGVLSLTIPEALLEVSAYPATVTATVSGELGMDNPVTIPALYTQSSPDVAYGNGVFLVCWEDSRRDDTSESFDIYCARIKDGVLLDTGGIPVCTFSDQQRYPSVASDGSSFAVIWEDSGNLESTGIDLYGASVNVNGTVAAFTVSKAIEDQRSASIAFNGTQFLAVWQDERNTGNKGSGTDIYGKLFHPSSSTSSTFGISTTSSYEYDPDVACNATNCLVVWEADSDIHGRSVSASGAMGTTFAIMDSDRDQESPAVAYGGGYFLVAWEDERDIYATRVNSSFAVSSTISIVSLNSSQQYAPAIAFDSVANRFLVVWNEGTTSCCTDIYGARVSTSGAVGANFVISSSDLGQASTAVAFDGSCMLVTWTIGVSSFTDTDIRGARVCSTTVASNTLISSATNPQYDPAVAFDGTNYMVVWTDFRNGLDTDIYGTRVSPSGSVLNTSGIKVGVASGDQLEPDLACDGTNCLVCWTDDRSDYPNIYCARVKSSAGTVIDTLGFALPTAQPVAIEPVLAFDGTNYLVVYGGIGFDFYIHVYGMFVTQSAVVNFIPFNISGEGPEDQYAADLAFEPSKGNYLVVWQDARSGTDYDIYGALVTKSGQVAPSVTYHSAAGDQTAPTVALGGSSNFIIVWEDTRNGTGSDLYGARVTATNTLGARLTLVTATNEQEHPSIASDGTNYLLVWQEENETSGTWDIKAMRLDRSGIIAETTSISASTSVDEVRPVVAFGAAGKALVAYDRFDLSAKTGSNRVKARIVIY